MQISTVRPVVRTATYVARPAVEPAPAPAAASAPANVETGGKSGFFGLIKALFLNGFGSASGLLSIRNDLKEFEAATGSQKFAHGVELAGDALNILSWPAAFIPGYGKAIGGAMMAGGWITKTVGEMIAGKD